MTEGGGGRRLEELFRLASDLPPEEREGFYERHCGDDAELRERLAALLEQDDRGTGELLRKKVLSRPPAEEERIGRYRILELLGEGGMGSVLLAEQEEPVRRKVALKMIRIGTHSDEVVRRFEAERQALAEMDHPGIAKLLDGGVTEAGLPYFVMEYVPGLPLDEYCEGRGLGVRARLELFVRVCEAVQHAHQNGIVHRDLKPGNVLVGERDDRPAPRIIDFGIARALSGPLSRERLAAEKPVGTRAYMSPEQSDPRAPAVDTRADIYSLGVILYELLTGTRPFASKRESPAPRDERPPPPSARVVELAAAGERLPAGTGGGRALARALRGDLDWITGKAMERERTRRYASASELAADVERHLRGEPVLAAPSSAVYRARKLVGRHRVLALVGGLLLVSLAAGIAVTVLWMRHARSVQEDALARLDRVTLQSEKFEAIVELLWHGLFHADPSMADGEEITVRGMLDIVRQDVRELFAHRPAEEAAVRATLGRAYLNLGEDRRAREQLDDAMRILASLEDPAPEDVFAVLADLIEATRRIDGKEAVGPMVEQKLRLAREILQESKPELRSAWAKLADVAQGADVPSDILDVLDEVLEALPDGVRRSDDSFVLGRLILRVGGTLLDEDDPEADRYVERVVAKVREMVPRPDIRYLTFLWILANRYLEKGGEGYARALDYAQELSEAARTTLPADHWLLPEAKRCRGIALAGLGRLEEAEPLLIEAYDDVERIPGRKNPRQIEAREGLSEYAAMLAARDDAESALRDSWRRWRAGAAAGRGSWWVVAREGMPREAVARALEVLSAEPHDAVVALHRGMALCRLGRADEALDSLRRGGEPDADVVRAFRGLCLQELGRDDEADEELLRLRRRLRTEGGSAELRALVAELERNAASGERRPAERSPAERR